MNIRKQLEELRASPPVHSRGEWNHYRCFMCDDKSAHLGIHASNGWVKCLRCGFSYALETKLSAPPVRSKCGISLTTMFSEEKDSNRPLDVSIEKYMCSRGLPNPHVGWAYGRGVAVGKVVFPIRDETGAVVYVQYRGIVKGDRYRSPVGSTPRLDFYPVTDLNAPDHTLILTEGPVDSLRVRQVSNMWASPAFGMTVNYMADLHRAMVGTGLKRVLIWLDAERGAEIKANRMMRDIRRELGLKVTVVSWRVLDDADPGAIRDSEILDILMRVL